MNLISELAALATSFFFAVFANLFRYQPSLLADSG